MAQRFTSRMLPSGNKLNSQYLLFHNFLTNHVQSSTKLTDWDFYSSKSQFILKLNHVVTRERIQNTFSICFLVLKFSYFNIVTVNRLFVFMAHYWKAFPLSFSMQQAPGWTDIVVSPTVKESGKKFDQLLSVGQSARNCSRNSLLN